MVRIWSHNTRDKNAVDARIKNLRPFHRVPLSSGQSLRGVFPADVVVLVESSHAPTDYFEAGPMKLVSERLKGIFTASRVNGEFFPVELQQDAKHLSGFWCLNVLETVDCLDWSDSKYFAEKGFARKITRLVLRPDAIQDQPLFRIARTIPVLIAVSDDLATKVTETDCTGIALRSPEEWSNPDVTIKY